MTRVKLQGQVQEEKMNSIDISAPGITDLKYTKHKNILFDIQKKQISRMTDKILIQITIHLKL